jgi:hypothetical protein
MVSDQRSYGFQRLDWLERQVYLRLHPHRPVLFISSADDHVFLLLVCSYAGGFIMLAPTILA